MKAVKKKALLRRGFHTVGSLTPRLWCSRRYALARRDDQNARLALVYDARCSLLGTERIADAHVGAIAWDPRIGESIELSPERGIDRIKLT